MQSKCIGTVDSKYHPHNAGIRCSSVSSRKPKWRTIVHDFRIKHEFNKIKRTDFSVLVKECFDKTLKHQTIQSAFECTGLYPFNVEKIKLEKLQTNRTQAPHVISSQA